MSTKIIKNHPVEGPMFLICLFAVGRDYTEIGCGKPVPYFGIMSYQNVGMSLPIFQVGFDIRSSRSNLHERPRHAQAILY